MYSYGVTLVLIIGHKAGVPCSAAGCGVLEGQADLVNGKSDGKTSCFRFQVLDVSTQYEKGSLGITSRRHISADASLTLYTLLVVERTINSCSLELQS